MHLAFFCITHFLWSFLFVFISLAGISFSFYDFMLNSWFFDFFILNYFTLKNYINDGTIWLITLIVSGSLEFMEVSIVILIIIQVFLFNRRDCIYLGQEGLCGYMCVPYRRSCWLNHPGYLVPCWTERRVVPVHCVLYYVDGTAVVRPKWPLYTSQSLGSSGTMATRAVLSQHEHHFAGLIALYLRDWLL